MEVAEVTLHFIWSGYVMSPHIFPQAPTFYYNGIFLFAKRLMNKDLPGSCHIS